MKSLMELQAQIDDLQRQAAEIREKDTKKTIEDIRAMMRAFGITHADLSRADRKAPRKKVSRTALKSKQGVQTRRKSVPVKYAGPAGQVWSGRGRTPVWLRELIDQGQKAEQYLVKVDL